ncbi:MAG TPA: substrate-binding domain-containing protein [Bryobacteraceae bacterium]|nr:substrate-binding domain-containing protein [Bryobacteraceae bacterium]
MRRFLAIAGIVLLLAGCRARTRPVVGVVPKGANHIFWQTVHAGAVKAGQEFKLDIEWNAPTLEIDSSRQIAIVESMINRRLAGIALAPVDRKALVNVVDRAHATGIPVAIFDSDIDTNNRITYVATDNREGGRMAARRLGELMLGSGKCAIIGFMPGSASTMEREEGFQQELKSAYPKIRMVQLAFGMARQAQARAATENILSAHPDLTGLFADNESSSAGAVMALRGRRTTQVRTVAFDSNTQLIDDLRDRFLDALIVQDPMKMGYESVKAIARKLRGENPPAHIDSGVYLVDRSNLERPDILPLLYPDIKRYLEPRDR